MAYCCSQNTAGLQVSLPNKRVVILHLRGKKIPDAMFSVSAAGAVHTANLRSSNNNFVIYEQNIQDIWTMLYEKQFYYPFNNTSMKTICTRYITF